MIQANSQAVPAADRGLAYGDGLFETIRMSGQKALLRQHHLRRMASDAARLGIPADVDDLDRELTRAARRLGPPDDNHSWILKLILTRGNGGRGYRPPQNPEPHLIASSATLPPLPGPEGVVARCSSFPLTVNPKLAGIKTLNRLQQVMASREFTGAEWELIMKDGADHLVEGTRTNLIARLGDCWVTPPASSVAVAGVMRQYVMERLVLAGETVLERPLPADLAAREDLRGFYLLNSVFGVVAVRSFEGADLPVDGTLATICGPIETLE
ncbi:aminotransferase class IV [Marinobacter confluentis]|uniref:aminotransferase class IV n=1 Tax=Marinobacter confluentis TaxID=1697557 RepID=UPI0029810D15|nr:aminotransferase class IV [Marinobacter confluentis]